MNRDDSNGNEAPGAVEIYTDGACEPNPGAGGYGAILIHGDVRKELHGGFRLTTNNRMEIFAAIAGLEALKAPCKVRLHSDSKYLVDSMSKGWARRWKAKGWWRTKKEMAVNADLWKRLLIASDKHQVEFVWVKGHAGHPENERADELSTLLLKRPDLPTDDGYNPLQPRELPDIPLLFPDVLRDSKYDPSSLEMTAGAEVDENFPPGGHF